MVEGAGTGVEVVVGLGVLEETVRGATDAEVDDRTRVSVQVLVALL